MPAFARAALVALCAVIALDLGACGGTHHAVADTRSTARGSALTVADADAELPANAVLRVGANLVTQQYFAHWMRVEATLSGSRLPAEQAGLREETAEILILHYWVQEEAAAAGIRLSPDEEKQLRRHVARLSEPDEALIARDHLLLEKWRKSVLPIYARLKHKTEREIADRGRAIDEEITALAERARRRWAPKTFCREGYVVSLCGDYHR